MNVLKTLIVALILTAGTAVAGKYDGTPWGVGFSKAIPFNVAQCEVCLAENGQATMTECGPPSAMRPDTPYVVYCGSRVWGQAGTVPGTRAVTKGGTAGGHTAGEKDFWTVLAP